MEETRTYRSLSSPEVQAVVEEVVALLRPSAIYLYNQKTSIGGDILSFKLCIVANCTREEGERSVYRCVDSTIPFDVLIYTPEDWERLNGYPNSFARRVSSTGTVVYG